MKQKKLEFKIQGRSFDVALHQAIEKAADWAQEYNQGEAATTVELKHIGTNVLIDESRRGNDVVLHLFEVWT